MVLRLRPRVYGFRVDFFRPSLSERGLVLALASALGSLQILQAQSLGRDGCRLLQAFGARRKAYGVAVGQRHRSIAVMSVACGTCEGRCVALTHRV